MKRSRPRRQGASGSPRKAARGDLALTHSERRGPKQDHRERGGRAEAERGAAVADFAMVGGLLMLIFAMVFQLGLTLHVRNTLISCAAEGARLGARADAYPGDGVARARDLIGRSLSTRFAQDVTVSTASVDGVAVVVIRVRAPLPLIGPFGPSGGLDVVGRAFEEKQ